MKLIWFDLESSGLDPRRDDVLEVACAVADLERPFEVGEVRSWVTTFRWAPWSWHPVEHAKECSVWLSSVYANAKGPGVGW